MRSNAVIILLAILVFSCDNEKGNKGIQTSNGKNDSIPSLAYEEFDSNQIGSDDDKLTESMVPMGESNKAYVSLSDSSISLRANMRLDHRFFGYEKPDTSSKRLLLLSIFTNDVKDNPFKCELGSYYDTYGLKEFSLKYVSTEEEFIKAEFINKSGEVTIVYFEKEWMEFGE